MNVKFALLMIVIGVFLALFIQMDADLLLYITPDVLPENSNLKDKTVWVVGASSGIGAQISNDLCKLGANVILSSRRENKLLKVVELCKESNSKYTPSIELLDVSDHEMIETAYKNIINKHSKIDILLLNAGQSQRNIALETPVSDTIKLFQTNFFSFVKLVTTVVPSMEPGSQVVVTSSVAGRIGAPGGSSYSATKFALQGYFDTLRSEMSMTSGIDILTVLPGPVESEIVEKAIRGENIPESQEGEKMSTSRCTQLMIRAMSYPKLFDEIWISTQPVLATINIYTYLPWVAKQVAKRVLGPKRVEAMREGGNIFDAGKMFGLKK